MNDFTAFVQILERGGKAVPRWETNFGDDAWEVKIHLTPDAEVTFCFNPRTDHDLMEVRSFVEE